MYDGTNRPSEGLIAVELSGKWGFIDETNNIVIPMIYSRPGDFSEGLANVRLNDGNTGNKSGHIDKTNKIVIPLMYDDIGPFSEGLARIKSKRKYGFIDKTNNLVIPVMYDEVSIAENGLVKVKLNGEKDGIYFNKKGEKVEKK
jgi:hypothetical protein